MRAPRSEAGVSPIVAIILLVAITVVLTGVLYIIVQDLAYAQGEVPPRVLFVNVGNPAGEAQFRLSVAEIRPLDEFQIRLWVDGALDGASEMKPVAAGTVGNVTYSDFDGGGTVTEGDTVFVSTIASTEYSIALLWKGHVVDRFSWST